MRVEPDENADSLLVKRISSADPEWARAREAFPVGARIEGADIVPEEAAAAAARGLEHRGLAASVESRAGHGPAFRVPALVPYGELTAGNDPYDRPTEGRGPWLRSSTFEVIAHEEEGPRLLLSRARCLPPSTRVLQRGDLVPAHLKTDGSQLFAYWDLGQVVRLPSALEKSSRRFSWLRVAEASEGRVLFDRVVTRRPGRLIEDGSGELAIELDDGVRGPLGEDPSVAAGEDVEVGLQSLGFGSDGPSLVFEECSIRKGARMEAKVLQVKEKSLAVDLYGQRATLSLADLDPALRAKKKIDSLVGRYLPVVVVEEAEKISVVQASFHDRTQSAAEPGQRRRLTEEQLEVFRRFEPSAALEAAYGESRAISGMVLEAIKGGFLVDIGARLPAFLPATLAGLQGLPPKPQQLIGRVLDVKILDPKKDSRNLLVSHRACLEEDLIRRRAELLPRLVPGAKLGGRVKNIVDYGVFVDLGGIDGLLHITDISWKLIKHPSEVFSVDENIEVVVMSFEPETERVQLGYKQLVPDPWDSAPAKYPVGSRVERKVARCVDFGVFIELEPGVDCLIHSSEMSWVTKHPVSPEVGESVTVVVTEVNQADRRMSASIRQAVPNPWQVLLDSGVEDTVIEVRVRNFTDFGAFVEVTEEIDGLIHVSDMSVMRKVSHPSEVLELGEVLEARVVEIDVEKQRVQLSIREFLPNRFSEFEERFQVGDAIQGKIVNVTDFGLFVDVYEGMEGLVHLSEIEKESRESLHDSFEIGQTVEVHLLQILTEELKIRLTMKGPERLLEPVSDHVLVEAESAVEAESTEEAELTEEALREEISKKVAEVDRGQLHYDSEKSSLWKVSSHYQLKKAVVLRAARAVSIEEMELKQPLTRDEFLRLIAFLEGPEAADQPFAETPSEAEASSESAETSESAEGVEDEEGAAEPEPRPVPGAVPIRYVQGKTTLWAVSSNLRLKKAVILEAARGVAIEDLDFKRPLAREEFLRLAEALQLPEADAGSVETVFSPEVLPWAERIAGLEAGVLVEARVSRVEARRLRLRTKEGVVGFVPFEEVDLSELLGDSAYGWGDLTLYFAVGDRVQARILEIEEESERLTFSLRSASRPRSSAAEEEPAGVTGDPVSP